MHEIARVLAPIEAFHLPVVDFRGTGRNAFVAAVVVRRVSLARRDAQVSLLGVHVIVRAGLGADHFVSALDTVVFALLYALVAVFKVPFRAIVHALSVESTYFNGVRRVSGALVYAELGGFVGLNDEVARGTRARAMLHAIVRD